jgi:hypothetical protein
VCASEWLAFSSTLGKKWGLPVFAVMLSMLAAGFSAGGADGDEAQLLVDTIESLQRPVEDFRCEFEGTRRHKGPGSQKQKLGEDGLADVFSGSFTWRAGDFREDSLHRMFYLETINWRTILVRAEEQQAEKYIRATDGPIGAAYIQHPRQILRVWDLESPQAIFLIDELKYDLANGGHEALVGNDEFEGRDVKVLKIRFKYPYRGVDGANHDHVPFRSYWIDLRRSGQVVRAELYWSEKGLLHARRDIKLAPFKVGGAEIWMPVSGEQSTYSSSPDDKYKLMLNVLGEIHVVNGTMEFNKHPGRDVFTIKYKPGTPVSDSLRKLQYEFGQQSIRMRPTRAEAEKMLKDQLQQADRQKNELVVASPEGFDWMPWLPWGLGTIAAGSAAALWFERRRR